MTGTLFGGEVSSSPPPSGVLDDQFFILSGSAAAIVGERGNDRVLMTGGTIAGAISGSQGADEIIIEGGVVGAVNGEGVTFFAGIEASQDDRIVVNGGTVTGAVSGGIGNDIVEVLSGSVGSVAGEDGNDSIAVSGGTVGGALAGGAGNDLYTLSGGTVGSVLDTAGDNTLVMPAGGTAAVAGTVIFGSGKDRIEIHSGSIAGHTDQGLGRDTFIMSGGEIASLDQGGELDVAVISGGRIIGAFNDGDDVTMTDGRIGTIDLKVANNIFRMSGGLVDGDVKANFQNDTLEFSGGRIGGTVNFGRGTNKITVSGGEIVGGVITGDGVDTFTALAGIISGPVNLGDGNNSATVAGGTMPSITTGVGTDTFAVSGGTVGDLASGAGDDALAWTGGSITGRFDGGNGSDTATIGAGADLTEIDLLDGGDDASVADGQIDILTFQGVVADLPNVANWEEAALTQGTQLNLGPGMTTFDAATTTIDDTSSLKAPPSSTDSAEITGDLDNAGVVDLSDGDADLDIGGDVDNSGKVDLSGGSAVVDIGGDLDNSGTVDLTDSEATVAVDGDLDNTGEIDLSNGSGSVDVTGDVDNPGALDLTESTGTVAVDGDLDNTGEIDLTDSTATIDTTGAVDNSGTIAAGGNATIATGDGLINDGLIDMTDGGTGNQLTVVGDVSGEGVIAIETDIKETSGTADTVDVDGSLTGDTELQIDNVGTPPVNPPAADLNVAVIAVSGNVDRPVRLNPPFGYEPIGPWRFEAATTDTPGGGQAVGLKPIYDGVDLAAIAPSAAGAIVSPEAIMATMGMYLPQIREREGQARTIVRNGWEGWFRAVGDAAWVEGAGYDVGYDQMTALTQLGWGYSGPSGFGGDLLKLGLTAGMSFGDWNGELRSASADLSVSSYAFGAYATWFQDESQKTGWYFDAIGQYSWYDFDLSLPVGAIAQYDGTGFGGSAEVGYLHPAGDWLIEPQVRLLYVNSAIGPYVGRDGLVVQDNNNDRLTGRLALRLSRDMPVGNAVLTPSLVAAVWQDFAGASDVMVGFRNFETNRPGTIGEVGLGVDFKANDRWSLFGQATLFAGASFWEVTGRAGFKVAY